MTLDVNKEELTILGIPFDNFSDFDTVWYAIGSSMIENYQQTKGIEYWLKINTKAMSTLTLITNIPIQILQS